MWKKNNCYFSNLGFLFWKPKLNITYRTKSTLRGDAPNGVNGLVFGTNTEIKFVDKEGKEVFINTFRIDNSGKLSTKKGKKIMWFNSKDFSFKKSVERNSYYGQGGGNIRTFTYKVIQNK
jgi:hypothetical protein